MKTYHEQPEPVLVTIIKISICLMLCLLAVRAAQGQTPGSVAQQSADALRDKVRQTYTSQIGIREKEPNAGAEVEKYLGYVKLPKGNPWCAAFVCWVLGQAGMENPRTGWSPGLFVESKVVWSKGERGKVAESGKLKAESGKWREGGEHSVFFARHPSQHSLATGNPPLATDVFGIYFPEKKRIAHVGFVDAWDGTWLTTVEGNTNVLGSREGDGVYRKRRLVSSIYKVARYIN